MEISNDYAIMKLESGIVIGKYNEGIVIDLSAAKEVVQLRLEASNYKIRPILVDGRFVKSITKEARDYFGSDEGSELLSAAAILSESALARALANFVIKVNFIKSPFPVRMFSNKKDALTWLEQYK